MKPRAALVLYRRFVLICVAIGLTLLMLAFPLGGSPRAHYLAPEIHPIPVAPLGPYAGYVAPEPGDTSTPDRWGEITIAQPKVWQYERVNALLDGLLRDVEGVSMADLVQLDPNKQNAAAIKFVQSALGIAVQYDQAAQVNNSNTLQNWQTQHDVQVKQLDEYNNYMQGLTAQRDQLTRELFSANNVVTSLQSLHDRDPNSFSPAQQDQLTAAQGRATNLNTQLTQVNAMITNAGPAPSLAAPPTVTGTSATAPAAQLSNFGDLLKSLPSGVINNLSTALNSPTYPATKQMDSFITLLHERLAREISAMQDDLIRDPNTSAYLVQFDVGLYPSSESKNHMARVEFELKGCGGCKVYSLYPGQSSYNVANYQGSSKRRSFAGNVATLIGLGISANYQRQEDALKGSLVQSIYISGFQDDTEDDPDSSAKKDDDKITQHFGWYYNTAPFDEYVTPGIRSTFAIITVPQGYIQKQTKPCNINPSTGAALCFNTLRNWPHRDNPKAYKSETKASRDHLQRVAVRLPGSEDPIDLPPAVTSDKQRLHILRMEYNTVTYKMPNAAPASPASPATASITPTPTPSPAQAAYPGLNGCKKDECATILLTLDAPIDPNLVVTVHGTPLHRVRDWRGRATSVLPPVQSLSDIGPQPAGVTAPKSETVASRSLLETDQLEPNSWFAVTSHDLLLNISHDLAGEEAFPMVQISDPGKRTLVIPNDLRQNFTEIIFDGFRLLPNTKEAIRRHVANNFTGQHNLQAEPSVPPLLGGPYPYSTFAPLFIADPDPVKFYAFVGETREDLIIGVQKTSADESSEPHHYEFIEARSSVILEDKDLDLGWSLSCTTQGEELVCKLPINAIQDSYRLVTKECEDTGCSSIRDLIQSLVDNGEFSPAAFAPNLQVWVGQSDPQGKDSFWSPEPAKLGLFPLGEAFSADGKFKPWHFDGLETTADEFSLEACNYLGSQPANARVRYLTPLEFPSGLVSDNLTPLARSGNCRTILLPTQSLQFPEIVLQTSASQSKKWTDAIPTSRLRPSFGRAKVEPIFDLTANGDHRNRIAGWDIRIPVNRAHCMDKIDLPESLLTQLQQALTAAQKQIGNGHRVFEWLDGSTPFQSGQLQPVTIPYKDDHCGVAWWQRQSTGQIQLHFIITKQFARLLPSEIHLIRTDNNSVSIAVAKLPSFRKLILPAKLKVEFIGNSQFALRGGNAGTIDAVVVQNGSFSKRYDTGTGVDFALVNAVVTKTETPTDNKSKTKPKQTTAGAATAPTSNPTPAPSATQPPIPGTQTVVTTQASARNPAGSNPPASGTGAPATPADKTKTAAKPKTTTSPLAPGTYALVPLILDGKNYFPIEVTDEQGKALTFTVPEKKDATPAANKNEPDETVTITKTTKAKAAPNPSPAPSPASTPAVK